LSTVLFQEHEHKISKKEPVDALFKRVYYFVEAYFAGSPQILFKFADHTSAKSSGCARAVKTFSELEQLLVLGDIDEAGSQTRSISNISADFMVGGRTLYLSDRKDELSPLTISPKLIANILEGVPRRFPFGQILIVLSNIGWQKEIDGVSPRKLDATMLGYSIEIKKHSATLAQLDGLSSLIEIGPSGVENPEPINQELADWLNSIGKIDNKSTKTWLPKTKLKARLKLSDDYPLKAKELQNEMTGYLADVYKQRKFPHYLEDWVVLRKYERFDEEGRRHYQPDCWVPIESVMPQKGSELPTSLSERIDKVEYQRLITQGWIEPMGGGAQITIDGVVCDVWPHLPEEKKSIPRKKIIMAAFKPLGFVEALTESGMLEISKNGDGYFLSCMFDFGTWSRNMSVVLTAADSGKSVRIRLPIFFWLERGMPILSESFFRKSIENAAFSAAEIEDKFLPKILKLWSSVVDQ
jgi:hypothetical protein